MKKPKSIFYLVYFLFHVILLGISIYVNYRSEDFEFLLKLRANMALMIYITIFGLLLFVINMVVVSMDARNMRLTREKLENEVNSMKAKMFDLQEATSRVQQSEKEVTDSGSEEDDTFKDKE